MLYLLYEFFNLKLHILQYISVRAGFGFFIAFFLTLYILPRFISWAVARKAQQPINKYVPNHASKQNTPTMGGAVFVIATLIGVLLTADMSNPHILGGVMTIIGFGLVGFKDDLGKILTGDNLQGLTSRGKLILQAIVGIGVSLFLVYVADFPTTLYIPFFKGAVLDMGISAVPFWILVFLATTNAVNLTDGLDGLATVPSIVALSTLAIIIYVTGHAIFSGYLHMPNIKGVGELTILAVTLSGALLGFLWYNCYPAEIFMGDTGSLAIGGIIAYLAIVGKSEVLLVLIGLIFVIETISVILQIGSYKLRKKRVFLMAPIHHHFEMKKWAENKIIVRFWMISILSNLVALITLKIR
ncbi:phospho-N-acetylmuramoyl-pentapeptide-transferase [Sulfurovum sp. bin170]|uniref:phospho-N-acetylmuramoyl-pentapeptide- transferase n=1 Tax=Sulfurovum sp. bin170 TaxID=2695268 RepID=UPI0013DE8A19|nr:phospho-N-acetylmuramoyl-pentapeptide-transferase [Sulfurovum sp. bin170]NEW60132.1 phospho-N-acetylmuramoyl-pentapeptide-transferase [Sulfurovum sp. bin170]